MQIENRKGRPAAKAESQILTFLLQNEEFGFDIMSVQEIIRVPRMARVPHTPPYVDGIANLRGVVLPVIDLRTRFGMERTEDTKATRILVVDNDGVKTGLRVDVVKQVTRVLRTDIEPPPSAIQSSSAEYLEGVVKLDDGERIVMTLNAARVCRFDSPEHRPEHLLLSQGRAQVSENGPSRAGHDDVQLVTFRIGKEELGFRMEHVREVLRVRTPKQVPDVPDYVLGVLTVRGRILPIVDLGRLLHQRSLCAALEQAEQEIRARVREDQRIIVVDTNGFGVGFVVDHVNEVLNVPHSLLEPAPTLGLAPETEVRAIAKLDDGRRLILLLDPAHLIRDQGLHIIQDNVMPETAHASSKDGGQNGACAGAGEVQMVTLMLGAVEYGVPISKIQEIDRVSRITKVPKSLAFLEGVTNLRGEVIPVLDARKYFGLELKQSDDRTRIMIVDLNGVKTGLIVDSVREVLMLSHRDIAPAPESIQPGFDQQFISGIGKLDSGKRMVILLDLDKVLSKVAADRPEGLRKS